MTKKYSLQDAAEFEGAWYLPDDAERRRIGGTLRWGESTNLSLHDTFQSMEGDIFGDEVVSYDAIHGETTDGHQVSILNAFRSGVKFAFGTAGVMQPERIVASFVVIGAHVTPRTLYSEVRFRIPGLEIWIERGQPQQTFINKTEASPAGMQYTVHGVAEEIVEVPTQEMSLGWGIDRNFSGNVISEISVMTSACVSIKSESGQDIDWFLTQFGKLKVLLSMICGSSMATDHMDARVADSRQQVQLLIALRDPDTCSFKNQNNFFMLRNSMGVELSATVGRWFELYDKVAQSSQLALSILASEKLWLHVEFLSLMQALEGFHRAVGTGFYASDIEYEKIRKALCAAIPDTTQRGHREALKARIKYGNEISLRKRLDILIARLSDDLRKQILGGDGLVPSSWIHTRNYYTHWDEASKDGVLDGLGMHQAGVRIKVLLRALYLDFAGIPQQNISAALRNACKESQYLAQLNAQLHRQKNPGSKAGIIMTVSTSPDPGGDAIDAGDS